ncbi:SWI SNF-, matrix-associated actin-dependent regulator of chromatin, subfamily a, containing DEAD H box [Arthrobotrys musiformis]|uniref:DNA helicase n=1 Tax=Arthrobotrys musiformis TaxID=47236 RepID=A0AAV9WB64_9PEZI
MDSYDYTNGRSPKRLKQFAEPTMQGLLSDETPAAISSSLPPTYPLPGHDFDDDDDIMASSPPATIPTQLVATQVLSTPTRTDLPSTIPTQIIRTPLRNGNHLPATALQYDLPSTVPTQIIGTPTQIIASPSVVQVAASSPVVKESPIQQRYYSAVPSSRGLSVSTTPTPPTKPPYVVKVDLNSDMEVPYAGSSSEDEETKSATNTSATAFYQKRPKASPRVSESPVQRVDPVANMRNFAGQFAFAAATKAPIWSRAAVDLEKLKTGHAKATATAQPQSRPAPGLQRGPAVPRPSAVIDLSEDSTLVEKLQREFPEQGMQRIVKAVADSNHDYRRAKGALQRQQLAAWGSEPATVVPKILRVYPYLGVNEVVEALIKTRGSYDQALETLGNRPRNPPNVIVVEDDDKEVASKAKRNTQRAPTKTIREKFSHISATQPLPPSPAKRAQSPPTPSEGSSLAPKPRRRLVQGKKLQRTPSPSPEEPPTVDLLSSDEEAPEELEDEVRSSSPSEAEADMLSFINSTDVAGLVDLSFTDEETAELILSHRPFSSIDDIREVVNPNIIKGRGKNAKPKNIGDKVADQCIETWEGFMAVDTLLQECKALGVSITDGMKGWNVKKGEGSGEGLDIVVPGESGSPKPGHSGLSQGMQSLMNGQPKLMAEDIQLKPYQVLGVKWLELLHELQLGCILADEMGLGKTCQVIGFLALLLEKGVEGPHIVVVPPSTLENWLREFQRFCPTLKVEPYYGSLEERQEMREALDANQDFNVIITTYNMFQGTSRNNKMDQGFLRKWSYNVAIFDEGHQLKNNTSDRAVSLSRLHVQSRILLTGTPLQNNLQELMNLLAFILPVLFENKSEHLNAIFKYKAKTSDNVSAASKLLSLERIKRAKAMMTPFVLRRRKVQVLHDLPKKFQHVSEVELTPAQAEVYQKTVDSALATATSDDGTKPITKTSLLMRLRQAAIHPMLARRFYTDAIVRKMARAIKREPQYNTEDHDVNVIEEEMLQYNDYELDKLCKDHPMTLKNFKLQNEEWMDSAKVLALKDILLKARENGDRVLVFSQFTMVLDILEKVLGTIEMPFLRLDGSTNVALRQELIDQFEDEKDITAFLLSTKAGGVGLNLAAANKVVIFDASFNPFDDLQAEDRAWRIGQTRDVHVIRIIAKGTIEENIDQLAKTKLMLDASVSGEQGEEIADFVKNALVKQIFNAED